jgi:hypothetical protein
VNPKNPQHKKRFLPRIPCLLTEQTKNASLAKKRISRPRMTFPPSPSVFFFSRLCLYAKIRIYNLGAAKSEQIVAF